MTAPVPPSERPPRLVLRFALYSAIALLAAGLAIFWVVRAETQRRAERELVGRGERVAARIGAEVRPSDLQGPVSTERARALDRAFRDELLHDLVLVKLWTRERVLAYSSDHALIGARTNDAAELDAALAGRTLNEVTNIEDEGGTQALKAIEVFVPVSRGGEPVAALELYFDYGPVARDVSATMTPVGVALGLALLLLYATLLPILRQVTKTLEARNARLSEHAGALRRALDERQQVERKLSAAEHGYRSLIEQLPLVTYMDRLDETSSSIYISPQVEGLLGHPAIAWLSDSEFFPKVLHPDDRERVLAHDVLAQADGEPASLEYRLLAKDGRVVWVQDHVMIARDDAGRPLHEQGFLLDITERKRAEEALAESETKFRAIVETTEEWVWEVDEHGVATYSNPAVERILGRAPEELVGRDSLEHLHPEDRERVELELPGLVERREGWTGYVLRWKHADGSYRFLESNATPILDADGRLRGYRGTDRDVTERMLAEAERETARHELAEQNERLRELDKLKDEFIALVSHELRTPLTSIRGYTELLLDEEAGGLTEEQRRFLGVVERNSHRLLHLVGDLLFLAQIEAGKLVLDVDALDLAALASESVEAARPAAEEKGITLTLATGAVPPLPADRARLGQLLDNLVSNAVKFTPPGGRVDVRTRTVAAQAEIEIRDSGIGIPAGEREFLFQRFFRTSVATEQAIQGTGLGLAISKAIVEAHDGEIDVESEEGTGTTFRVRLPLGQEASEPEPAAIAL